jgi:uncharacterized phage infection (PIP) family protein YhgE
MSNARKAALHLLSNEWSRGVWKHWLSNIFLPPVEPLTPRSAPTQPSPAPAPVAPIVSAPLVDTPLPASELARETVNTRGAADASTTDASATAEASTTARQKTSEPPDSQSSRDVRRSELRARFEALSDRLTAVEDGVDTLLRRSALRDKNQRRAGQQSVEAIDSVADAAERQAAALEGLLSTVSRLEHAISRLDSGLSRVERALGERSASRRDSHYPSAPSQPPQRIAPASQFPDSHLAPRSTRASDVDDVESTETSSINGFLSEVSLSTVMAMLEIERHSGRLKVTTDDGMLASFELAEGSVVSSRLSENDTDPLQTLRTALCWKHGRFWFRQQPAEAPSFAPRSIGSLLLEATRQNDESFADVG